MTIHKFIDRICCVAVIVAILITGVFLNAESLGIQASEREMGYETRLFDETKVHTIDIIIDDWEGFLTTCQSETYSVCNLVIDGEAYKNVGIRGKGNTSLSTVSSMDSDRYSFKIEFDQYDSAGNYYGLDKLCLNNVIQDNTYMKDFLVYQMMDDFGVDAPLCSYVYITVNGEDWGLYLAVEAVEESFLQRNNGVDYGELYKPDSMSFGGGRGNGKDFDMEEVMENFDFDQFESSDDQGSENNSFPPMPGQGEGNSRFPQMPGRGGENSSGFPQMPGQSSENNDSETKDRFSFDMSSFGGGFGGFGMGSSDVKLQYIDDDPDSYSNIFNSAKTEVSEADQQRLIASLKALSERENLEDVLDMEQVIRYFVVHNFVVNGDSYTGSMIHNYYLYEEDGALSMIPWDYNLAFGTFQGMDATASVNDPIDSPVSGDMSDRPMIAWIFENEEYTQMYHDIFAEFIAEWFDSGKFIELVDNTAELIASYVEKDPTKFCTYEEFETGVATIREFCLLRAESVSGQLTGTIPSTEDGQNSEKDSWIDASGITLSDMGTMGGGKGGNFNRDDRPKDSENGSGGFERGERPESSSGEEGSIPNTGNMPSFGEKPDMGNMPSFGEKPDMENMPSFGERPDMENMPSFEEKPGMSNFPGAGNWNEDISTGGDASSVLLLMASVVMLTLGLIAAYKFKR